MQALWIFFLLFSLANVVKGTTTHKKKFQTVGCFVEWDGPSRRTLFNDRNNIKWGAYPDYIDKLSDRCYETAKKSNYTYFSIRFYGICVGINDANGNTTTRCMNEKFKTCDVATDKLCAGKDSADMIYQVGIDGGYGPWSSYGSCSLTCGTGHSQRKRECNNPTPAANGNDCTMLGSDMETKLCKMTKCTAAVTDSFTNWSAWGPCSQTCDGGSRRRRRQCKPKAHCVGPLEETQNCVNDLCKGVQGVAKVQSSAEKVLTNVYKADNLGKPPSGKFYKSLFLIQNAMAAESVTDSIIGNKTSPAKKLEELETLLKISTNGGHIAFARETLGKNLYAFIQNEISNGVAIDDIERSAQHYIAATKNRIGKNNYDEILSTTNETTLMLVIDTALGTTKAASAYRAYARMAKHFADIKGNADFDYIVAGFDDQGVSPAKRRSNAKNFVSDIARLRTKNRLECPKKSFQGMLKAYGIEPKVGSPMFVFTDASAKDDTPENMETLKATAKAYSSSINFFTQGPGCVKGYQSYKEMAANTSGQFFSLQSWTELADFTNYIQTSLRKDTLIASGSRTGGITKRDISSTEEGRFNLDDGIIRLVLTIATGVTDSAKHVTLRDPSESLHSAKSTMSITKLFEIDNPSSGTWQLAFPDVVGDYKYTVEAVSGDYTVQFESNFMYRNDVDDDTPTYPIYDPIKAVTNMLVLRVGGSEHIMMATLQIDIVSLRNRVLIKNIRYEYLSSTNIINTFVTPPNEDFRILISGLTNKATPFERLSETIAKPVEVSISLVSAGKNNMAMAGQKNVPITVQVQTGTREYVGIDFEGFASVGSIPDQPHVEISKVGYAKLYFNVPPASALTRKTRLVRITVNAIFRRVKYPVTFSMLIL